MLNLVAQIVLDLQLDAIFIQRIDRVDFDGMVAQKMFVALVKLPKGLIGPLPIDPKMRAQF